MGSILCQDGIENNKKCTWAIRLSKPKWITRKKTSRKTKMAGLMLTYITPPVQSGLLIVWLLAHIFNTPQTWTELSAFVSINFPGFSYLIKFFFFIFSVFSKDGNRRGFERREGLPTPEQNQTSLAESCRGYYNFCLFSWPCLSSPKAWKYSSTFTRICLQHNLRIICTTCLSLARVYNRTANVNDICCASVFCYNINQ